MLVICGVILRSFKVFQIKQVAPAVVVSQQIFYRDSPKSCFPSQYILHSRGHVDSYAGNQLLSSISENEICYWPISFYVGQVDPLFTVRQINIVDLAVAPPEFVSEINGH